MTSLIPTDFDDESEANQRALYFLRNKKIRPVPGYEMINYYDEGNGVSGQIVCREDMAREWIAERERARAAKDVKFNVCKRTIVVNYDDKQWKMVNSYPNTEDGLGYKVIGPWEPYGIKAEIPDEGDGSVQVGDGHGVLAGQVRAVRMTIVADEREQYA